MQPTDNPFNIPTPTPAPVATDASPGGMPSAGPEYEFVRMPDGSIRAVAKSDIQNVSEIQTATQNVTATPQAPKVEAHFYVWLADGSVERVKESDLPGTAGANAQFGHWQREDKVYQIVAVYPVEDIVKGDK